MNLTPYCGFLPNCDYGSIGVVGTANNGCKQLTRGVRDDSGRRDQLYAARDDIRYPVSLRKSGQRLARERIGPLVGKQAFGSFGTFCNLRHRGCANYTVFNFDSPDIIHSTAAESS